MRLFNSRSCTIEKYLESELKSLSLASVLGIEEIFLELLQESSSPNATMKPTLARSTQILATLATINLSASHAAQVILHENSNFGTGSHLDGTVSGAGTLTFLEASRAAVLNNQSSLDSVRRENYTRVVSGAGTFRFHGSGTRTIAFLSSNTFSGDITFDGAGSRIEIGSLENGNYTGSISGDGTLNYGGSGTLSIASSSSNTFSGSSAVSNGALIIGDFTVAGMYDAEIDGIAAHDLIAVTGTVDLTDTYAWEDEIVLINNDGTDAIAGTFPGLAEGDVATLDGGWNWVSSYVGGDGNDFTLTVIPEPSTSLLGALGALALLRRQRA